MLHIACKHCGQQVEVADLLAAPGQRCPRCGSAVLGNDAAAERPTGVVGVMVKAYDW